MLPVAPTLPLVGRDGVLDELRPVLESARSCRGSLVLLTGEAGIGKTRLAEELTSAAEGFRVAWGWCGTAAGGPLQPWPQVLRALAAEDARVSRLVRRSPYLRGLVGAGPEGGGDRIEDRAIARRRLFDDVVELVAAAAAGMPLIIVLDDVHLAEASSLLLLAHLTPALASTAAVVLGTARDSEVAWQGRLEPWAAVLRRSRHVPLGPLAVDDVAALVAAARGGPASPEVAAAIAARTGGLPLFVTELVKLPEREGGAPATAVPASIRVIVAERIAGYPPAAREVLSAAAVLGTVFRLDVVAEVAGVDLADLRGLLAEAEVGGILTLTEPGLGRFVHELVRDAVYQLLPAGERAAWHERAGSVLAGLAERGRDVDLAEVAHQLLLAGPGQAGLAAEFAWRAADRAGELAAYDDAVRWYERAAGALELQDPGPARRGELRLRLGEARLGCGDRAGARTDFLAAAAVARAAGLPDLLARAALGLGSGPAGFEVDLLDREQIDLLEEARAALPAGEPGLLALTTARLSVAATFSDSPANRLDLAGEALRLARAAGDDRAVAYALSALCDAQAGPDHCATRLGHAGEMLGIAVRRHDPALELLARRLRVVALLETGDIAAADVEIAAFRSRAEALRHPLYLWYVPLWRGMRALMEGRFEDCRADNQLVETLGREAGSGNGYMLAMTQRWCLMAEVGDRTGIEALFVAFEALRIDALWAQVTQTLVCAQLGRIGEARRRLDAVAPRLDSLPRDSEWLASVSQVAETVALVGPHPVSRWAYQALAPYADLYVVEGIGAAVRGPVHRYLGLLAAAEDRAEVARRHLDAAVASSRALGATGIAARIEADAAGLPEARRGQGRRHDHERRPGHGDEPEAERVFRRDGEVWTLRYASREARVRDSKGMRDLAVLLARPGREVAAADLAGAVTGSDTGPVLDTAAREAYRRRLTELEQDAAEADARADAGTAARIAAERDALLAQLSAAYGLGGRQRRTGSPAERARTAVTARIRDAIRRVGQVHPELGAHLDRCVRTGTFCAYRPETGTTWKV